jgi:valyl-tRNA synthetase
MSLSKYYEPGQAEPSLQELWDKIGVYRFSRESDQKVFSIDTPPPTVSGSLHLGHIYSYSQIDFIARYRRMRQDNVFFPMGFDDNGLPTDRLVEKIFGIRAMETERAEFIEKCLQVSEKTELDYQTLWKRIGLSIDWRYTYRTIDEHSRRISQHSFLDLFKRGLVYQRDAPTIWCTECQTAISQADLNDIERDAEFVTINLSLLMVVISQLPQLGLNYCQRVLRSFSILRTNDILIRRKICDCSTFGKIVPILTDPAAEPEKNRSSDVLHFW